MVRLPNRPILTVEVYPPVDPPKFEGKLPVVDLGEGLAPEVREDLEDALRALGYVQ